jgi:hypothetical protein
VTKFDFEIALKALDRNGDRTRSTIYFFVVIFLLNGAFVINSYMNDIPRARLEGQAERLRDFLGSSNRRCEEFADFMYFDPTFDSKGSWDSNPRCSIVSYDKSIVDKIRQDVIIFDINYFISESIRKNASFTVPILGSSLDRDIFWLFSGFVGILGYFITSSLIRNEAETLQYVFANVRGSKFCIRMTLVTQIFGDFGSDIKGKVYFGLFRPILYVYMLPIAISVYMLLDELYVTDLVGTLQRNILLGNFNFWQQIADIYTARYGILRDLRYSPIRQSAIIFGGVAIVYIQYQFLTTMYHDMKKIVRYNYRARQELDNLDDDAAED